MKRKSLPCMVLLFLLGCTGYLSAHTVEETNALVRAALRGVVRSWKDYYPDGGVELKEDEVVDTWQGFLGRYGDSNWTLDGKIAAFDWYLTTLATNDCQASSVRDREMVRAALCQCDQLDHTNAVPLLRNYALNPRAVEREKAITLALEMGQVSSSVTEFVELFITNSIGFSFEDRSAACCIYAGRLLALDVVDANTRTSVTNAVGMLYRHREMEVERTLVVDEVFAKYIDGYVLSSNRLEFATNVLNFAGCNEYDRRDFTEITNQLLSSGRPLRQLNIGEEYPKE